MRAVYWVGSVSWVLLVGVGGCKQGGSSNESSPPPSAVDQKAAEAPAAATPQAVAAPAGDPKKDAEEIFATRCTPCHGPSGEGNGPASAGLVPKPRNYTDPQWQAQVTDEHIEKIILYGGAAVGKAPTMPPNPDLESKPEVIKALRAHIRSFRRP